MTEIRLTRSDRIALRQFLKGIQTIRKIAPEMRIHTIQVFLEIALNEEISSQTIMRKVGIQQSSCSRNLTALSETISKGRPGLGLVEYREDHMERRRKLTRLTSKGHEFAEALAQTMK